MKPNWNRFCKKLSEARIFLARLYSEVHVKAMGEWPADVNVAELDVADCPERPRKGRIAETMLWNGMHNVYGLLNMAWKLYRFDVRGEDVKLRPVHFEEFPATGQFAELIPVEDEAERVAASGTSDRPVSPTPVRIALQSALRKLTILRDRVSRLPGIEARGRIERPKDLLASAEAEPIGEAEAERRLFRIYSILNEAWNGRFDKTFATDPDEIRKSRLFPSEFLRLGGDAPEREQIKKHGCNLDLLRFHVTEAKDELESLLSKIKNAQGEELSKAERRILVPDEFGEWFLSGSLAHAYHHLNFAWNGRNKTMAEADAQFSRNEKFPRHFDRYWPRTALTECRDRI